MIEIAATLRCDACKAIQAITIRLACMPINPEGWANLVLQAIQLPEGWRLAGDRGSEGHHLWCSRCPPRGPYR
jgi:hypothetical protein